MGFNFGGNTGLSYDEIKRKRALLAGQVRQTASPNNFGQGLSACVVTPRSRFSVA